MYYSEVNYTEKSVLNVKLNTIFLCFSLLFNADQCGNNIEQTSTKFYPCHSRESGGEAKEPNAEGGPE